MTEPVEVSGVEVNIGSPQPTLVIVVSIKVENSPYFGSKLCFAKLRPGRGFGI